MAFVRTLLIIVTLVAGWAVLRGGVSAHLLSATAAPPHSIL